MTSSNLQQDLGGAKKSSYDARVHAMLLIRSGHSAEEVACLFRVDASKLLHWVRRLQDGGVEALNAVS